MEVASIATRTLKPSACSSASASARFARSSSTTRIVAASGLTGWSGRDGELRTASSSSPSWETNHGNGGRFSSTWRDGILLTVSDCFFIAVELDSRGGSGPLIATARNSLDPLKGSTTSRSLYATLRVARYCVGGIGAAPRPPSSFFCSPPISAKSFGPDGRPPRVSQ